MKWQKKGLVYCPDGKYAWAKHSALQPTPIMLSDEIIRVYVGFRDHKGVGRIGYVDVDAMNPSEIIKISENPVLDIGVPGSFDDNGVIQCAIVQRDDKLFLYYAGYQLGHKVRFLAFGGLAVSEDGGNLFSRYSKVPIMERTEDELLFRVIHSIMFEDGVWRAWYGGGSTFIEGEAKTLPVYNIRYIESDDGIHFQSKGKVCIDIQGEDEYRVGRPYVIRDKGIYRMFYSTATKTKGFRIGYAESRDGLNWIRKDDEIGIDVSTSGWDSQMVCYPSIIEHQGSVFMFYNGNDYGRTGFGYAVLEEW